MESKEISFSSALSNECRRAGLSVREKAFADLLVMGWTRMDAYIAAGLYDYTYPPDTNRRDMNAMLSEKGFAAHLRSRESQVAKAAAARTAKKASGDLSGDLSKEAQLRELVAAKEMHEAGSKEWIEIKKMIADITRVKKDEIRDDDTTIHYYLPVGCYNCSLYRADRQTEGR